MSNIGRIDQNVGIAFASCAIRQPLSQIVANAGEEGSAAVNKVRDGKGTTASTPSMASIMIRNLGSESYGCHWSREPEDESFVFGVMSPKLVRIVWTVTDLPAADGLM